MNFLNNGILVFIKLLALIEKGAPRASKKVIPFSFNAKLKLSPKDLPEDIKELFVETPVSKTDASV